jgi:exonuclease SbcC
MKIKQVKIQAFKSYLEEKDGTFDFSHGHESDVANIVSIYAPNGFGKTSFYDAVDFCITNNITRYIRDAKVRKKNDDLSKNNGAILRSRNACENLHTRVEIITSDNTVNKSREIKHSTSNRRDYLFRDSDTPENKKYFRDLMLSQEAIDAFLRETDPATRYEKFAENHVNELSELTNKRKQIQKILDDINTSVKTDNKTKQDKNIASLIVNVDEAILTKLDALISECDKLDLNITAIQNSFDEAKYKLLKLEIRSLLDTLAQDTIKKNLLKDLYLDFIESFEFVKSSIYRIQNASEPIHLFRIKQQLTHQKDDLIKLELKLSTLTNRYDQISEICNDEDSFFKKLSDKNDLLAQNKKLKKDLELIENEIKLLTVQVAEAEKSQYQTKIESNSLLEKEKNSQALFARKTELEKKLLELKNKNEKLVKDLSNKNLDLEKQNTQLKYVNNFDIHTPVAAEIEGIDVKLFNQFHTEFKENILRIDKLNLDLTAKKNEIATIEQHSSAISELIKLGSQIIEHTQTNNCPLCSHSHQNFETLKGEVKNNKALGSITSTLIQSQSEIASKIKGLEKENEAISSKYDESKNLQIQKYLDLMSKLKSSIESLTNDKSWLNSEIMYSNDGYESILKSSMSMNQAEYSAYLCKSIDDMERTLATTNDKIQQKLEAIQKLDNPFKSLGDEDLLIAQRIKGIEDSKLYQQFIEICRIEDVELSLDVDVLREKFRKLKLNYSIYLQTAKNNIQQLSEKIKTDEDKLPDALQKLTYDEQQRMIVQAEQTVKSESEKLKKYSNIFPEIVEITVFDVEQRYKDAKVQNQSIDQDIQKINERLNFLKMLESSADEALKLSESVKLQNEIDLLSLKISSLEKLQTTLKDDIELIDARISVYINDYFYLDVINEIYHTIDPHPEFKKIEFSYEASNSKPELHIKVKDQDNNEIIAPSLYFSSAQINVLSLSIFLAKALNTKDYDGNDTHCIFIDDPVQSMDSINVLSVIDLFRNIAFKFDKQLIISTHDENFHGLLKKKIPPHLFKSKFLKLESFGKVAVDQ